MLPILLALLFFGVIHSLLADHRIKDAFRRRFGDRAFHGLYRLIYNILAAVSLLPVTLLLWLQPSPIIWQVDSPAVFGLLLIQAAGALGLLISLLQIDLVRFLGLSQLQAYITDKPLPLPAEKLQIGGFYRWVRHPLYLFSLMLIWPQATMTLGLLAFNIGATLYFIIGSRFEEQRLIRIFGDQYLDYRKRVPWLVPLPAFFNSTLT